MLGRARLLDAAGYSIVMIDLQAHGESTGQQITYGHLERYDAQAAVEYARQAHPDEPVAVLGVSLGGAAALLASPLGIDALILESVFPDITDAIHNRVALNLGLLAFIPTQLLLVQLKPRLGIAASELRPIEYLPQVNCPILIISGIEDRRTTAAETEQMFATAKQPKELWMVPDASHVDLHRASPEEYETRVLGFLDQHIRP
jgi:alpha-beta hydrolase superfamily lysophospholipase